MSPPRIVSDPKIMFGKPVIEGTRITVAHLLQKMASGQSLEQILDDHRHITREGVLAALAFAAESMEDVTYMPTAQLTA